MENSLLPHPESAFSAEYCAEAAHVRRQPRAGRRRHGVGWIHLLFVLLVWGGLLANVQAAASQQGEKVVNTATFSFDRGVLTASATFTLVGHCPSGPGSTCERSRAVIDFFKYVSDSSNGQKMPIQAAQCADGSVSPLPIDASELDLSPTELYRAGEIIFVRVTDPDQNVDSSVRETISVSLKVKGSGESEVLRLTENGVDTGVFVGNIRSTRNAGTTDDCQLTVGADTEVVVRYVDASDGEDIATAAALVDPYGRVFNSATGELVDGVIVTLIDANTGQPAVVYGDDGVSGYPATVVSGGTVTDAGGVVYTMPAGEYRFPYVNPGDYRLVLSPPAGYAFPSQTDDATLQALPGAPFALVTGSRGERFRVPVGPAIKIDLPLDPKSAALYVTKRSVKSRAAVGEHNQYTVTVENPGTGPVSSAVLTDTLPVGFRYVAGSARRDGNAVADPAISADGRELTFPIGTLAAGERSELKYVVRIGAGTPIGMAVNQAVAGGNNALTSNVAEASVQIAEDLIRSRSHILGRVMVGNCPLAPDVEGELGIRLTSRAEGGSIHYQAQLSTARTPLDDALLRVELPMALHYRAGSALLNEKPLGNIRQENQVLLLPLGRLAGDFTGTVEFTADAKDRILGELETRAQLVFAHQGVQGLRTPTASNTLKEHDQNYRQTLRSAHFDPLAAEPDEAVRKELQVLIQRLEGEEIVSLTVEGHTDDQMIRPRSRHLFADNYALSEARARQVADFLAEALDLDEQRVKVVGHSSERPVATNDTAEGRALNRRVEVQLQTRRQQEGTRFLIARADSGLQTVTLQTRSKEQAPASIGTDLPGLEAVRLVMEDGRFADTDAKGLYHFEAVTPDVHVVQIDTESLPEGYAPILCEQNTRFAGSPDSQMVDVQGGTLHRADFYLRRIVDDGSGNLALRLSSAITDERVQYRAEVDISKLPLEHGDLMVRLPKGQRYLPGTAQIDGKPVADPKNVFGRLLFALPPGETPTWRREVMFAAALTDGGGEGEQLATAQLYYDTATAKKQKSVAAENRFFVKAASAKQGGRITHLLVGDSGRINQTLEVEVADAAAGADTAGPSTSKEPEGILSIEEGGAVATRIMAVRTRLGAKLKPKLTLDGQEIPADRVGFKSSNPNTDQILYSYIGVDLGLPGPHTLKLEGFDPFGVARFNQEVHFFRTGEVATIRLKESRGNLADGTTPVAVKLELRDGAGKVINGTSNLEIRSGELQPYVPNNRKQTNPEFQEAETMVKVDPDGTVRFAPVSRSGLYRFTLGHNDVAEEFSVYVKPSLRKEWLMVGIAEGTAAHRSLSGNMEALEANGEEDGYSYDGRLAFYAKGQIKGEYLLTLAYDSERESDPYRRQALFQTINPDSYYTLYGDNSVQRFDAPSSEKLYLRLEADQFNLLFGDFVTGLSATELTRYSRSLTGVRGEFENERFSFTGFASDTDQRFVRDEIRGDGTSGLYHLSRDQIRVNSAKVTIEVRDRFHSERILSRRDLAPFIDYQIDPIAGTLFFKQPVYSKDENFNPIYIIVEYEVIDSSERSIVSGGRGAVKLLDGRLEVGASVVDDSAPGAEAQMVGGDIRYELTDRTAVRAEVASSEDHANAEDRKGDAYLTELVHDGVDLKGRVYLRRQEDGYGIGSQAGSESGTEKVGAEALYRIDEHMNYALEASQQKTLQTGAERRTEAAAFNFNNDDTQATASVRHARDSLGNGEKQESNLLGLGASQYLMDRRLRVHGKVDMPLSGDDASSDYPTRLVTGADYLLTQNAKLFVQNELTDGELQDSRATRAGIEASPWSRARIRTALAEETAEYGPRTYANVGLQQGWQVNERLALDFGIDQTRTIRAPGATPINPNVPLASGDVSGNDFTAVTVGATYRELDWSGNVRVERLDSDVEVKHGLFLGFYRQQSPGVGFAATLDYFDSETTAGNESTQADLDLSLAYRPTYSPWIVLDRLTFSRAESSGPNASVRTGKVVNNINANYLFDRRNQIDLHHGIKLVEDHFDSGQYSSVAQLYGVEYRHDFTANWDLGAQVSTLLSEGSHDDSLGLSVGYNPKRNVWVSLGYNFHGFYDADFDGADYTAQGPFIRLRVNLDRQTSREVMAWWEKVAEE